MYYLLLKCAVIEELSMLHVFKITDYRSFCMVMCNKASKSGSLRTSCSVKRTLVADIVTGK